MSNCKPAFYLDTLHELPQQIHVHFTHQFNSNTFRLSKELHITQQQAPHANRNNEHYCRRWISLKTIQELESTEKTATFGLQISSYENSSNEYIVFSSATPDPFRKKLNRSVSIGLLLAPHLKKKLQFTKD